MRRADLLIVGGGPAGSAAALTLARAGRTPLLIERAKGPRDVVCGGFLGWDALARLRRLDVDVDALGARRIDRVRLVAGERVIEDPLPRSAAGLSRRTLDSALLQAADGAGATILRGRSVRAVERPSKVRLDDDEEIGFESLFLATGKHELRGAARGLDPRSAPAAGLRTVLPSSPGLVEALAGVVELHLFDGGYAGLLVQEGGDVNLCLSVSRKRLATAGDPQALVASLFSEAPLLAARIGEVPDSWIAVANVPYGWRSRGTLPGEFRLGDQAAVIASLAGDGIAIALASGAAAADHCLSGGSRAAPAYQRSFSRRARVPLATGEALRWAAEHRLPRRLLGRLLALAPGIAGLGARLTRIG